MEKRFEILLRILRSKVPFITGIDFHERDSLFNTKRIVANIYVNLSDLSNTFPNAKVDYDYLEDVDYQVHNPFHVFDNFREHDLSINNLVMALSRSIGVDAEEVVYHIED